MSGWYHEFSCKLAVSAERAFAALTRPEELKIWFAEHADIDPVVGGAYRFWGKHSYGTPTRAEADQKVLRIEPSRLLAFTWTIHDQPSEVQITIEPNPKDPAGVILAGTHSFAEAPRIDRAREMVDDLWRLQCGNLKAHLSGKGGLMLPDYTDPAPQVQLSILIDAPRPKVFQALMDPAVLNKWVASAAVVEPKKGGCYSYGWSYDMGGVKVEGGPMRILDLVENEKLVTDWPDWRGDKNVPLQTITWLLESVGAQTRVTLIHGGFVRTVDCSDYPFGWVHFLESLKGAAEGQKEPAGLPVGCA